MDSSNSVSKQAATPGKSTGSQISSVGAAELDRRRQQRKGEIGSRTPEASASKGNLDLTRKLAKHLQVTPTQGEQGDYIRLIRDGHADRVEAMVREVCRDIEIGRKTDRYTNAAAEAACEFENLAAEFSRKKELLTRIEERIGGLRKMVSAEADVAEIREALGHDQATAEKVARLLQDTGNLRKSLVEMAASLFDLRDRVDDQVRTDAKREDELRALINKYTDTFSAKERVNLEVRLEKSLRGKRIQERLGILEKFERTLADNTPEGRERRKQELLTKGRECLAAEQYEEAIPLLEQAHSLMLTDEEVLLDLAKAYKAQKRMGDAVKILKKVLQGGETVRALIPLAECLVELDKTDDALDTYERVIALRPDDLSIRVAQCRTLVRGGKVQEALRRLTELYARHPDSSEVALVLARVCVSGKLAPKAKEILIQLTKDSPNCVDGWVELADLYWKNRQTDNAEQAYRRLLQIDAENIRARIRLGDLARQSGDFQTAEEHYRIAEKVNGDRYAVRLGLGIVMRETGRATDAVVELERAVALNPQGGEAFHHLGLTYLMTGKTGQAAKTIQKAISFGFSAA
ncbi:MAG: tetratricopeptide repeat protein [bacterium]